MSDYEADRALAEVIAEAAGGPMDVAVVIEYLGQMAAALIELDRQNVVHTALNPYNIRVSSLGHLRFVGLTSTGPGSSLAGERDLAHTLPYVAPEVVQDLNTVRDIRTDIYSIGAVGYQMFTGRLKVDARTIRDYVYAVVTGAGHPAAFYNPNLAPACDAFLSRCLQIHPDDRYQTPFEMSIAIEDLGQKPVIRPTAVLRSASGRTYQVATAGGILGRGDVERKLALTIDLSGEEHGRTVSRRQAKLGCIRGQWVIVPCLGTTNATVLNGRTLESGMQYVLASGDELQIGGLKLALQLQHPTLHGTDQI